jgi:hypothetical protein
VRRSATQLLLPVLLAAACSDSARTGLPGGRPDASPSTSSDAAGSMASDGAADSDAVTPDAANSGSDSGSGAPTDSGLSADSGSPSDSDSGALADAGSPADSSSGSDSGAPTDSGLTADSGLATSADATADSGSADSGPPPTDAGPETAPCAALLACCPRLPSPLEPACAMTAAANVPGQCQSVLDFAGPTCADADAGPLGHDSGPLGPDASVDTDAAPTLGPECTTLLECCSRLPAQVEMLCTSTAEMGNEASCQNALQLANGACTAPADGGPINPDAAPADAAVAIDAGPSPACTALSACCPSFPAQFQSICDQTATAGDPAQCQSILNLGAPLCGAGDAGPPPPPPDSGLHPDASAPGPECAALLACCSNLPQPFQSECASVAGLGSETACQSALLQVGALCTPDAG